ncbi:YheC/YheD family protein [Thalassobacillus sp. C254]|uniref:YheC/YheD family protein n=1 Tax=Thalassobacillus sp. C254 TaxID=1225341 RepID=UPI0009F9E3E2|nr:YheC/YheD family protein [Thalassobacillus sp. C254]
MAIPDLTLRKHLPYTNKVTSIKEVKKMLNSYSSLYVKPIKGSEGRRILHIEKDGTTIKITNDTKGKSTVKRLDDYPLLKRRIKSNRPYLVQQGVATKHESRNIDFRIYMQKNEKKKWVSSGITARVSKPESIITNLRQLDYWITGPEALSQIFKLDEKSLKRQEEKIVSICTRACKKLDKKGTFGDIAIDFVVDKNLHVWILEMNLRHVYPVEDPNLAPEVKRTPFLYAMSLAGFPLKEKKEYSRLSYSKLPSLERK